MSIYLSIGERCCVKHQIDKDKGSKETHFFDWLGTDMNSVNKILSSKRIEEILHVDHVYRDPINPNSPDGRYAKVSLQSLTQCIFIHDLPVHMKDHDVREMIEKYKRRHQRLLDTIKSDQPIYFIRYGSKFMSTDDKNIFIETIQQINPNCRFTLVSLEIEQPENNLVKEPRFLRIQKTNKDITNDWEKNFLNWKQIFADIEEHG